MKNNKKSIIIVAVVLVILVGLGIYYFVNKTPEAPFYNESLRGIPNIENQQIIQDDMKEEGNNNTEGILTYKLQNTDKTLEEVKDDFIKKTDSKLWEVEEIESNDKNTKQLIYNSKDEKVKSTTQVTMIKAEKNIIITITSYYDNSNLLKESQKNNKEVEAEKPVEDKKDTDKNTEEDKK